MAGGGKGAAGHERNWEEFLGWESECGARAVTKNKGFARRPQEFLGWEEGDWEEEWVRYVGGGRGWEWRVGIEVNDV